MTITEKVSYLKGLVEGLGIDDSTKEGKVLRMVIDVLDDLAITVADLEDECDDMAEQIELVDGDLSELEDDYYGEEDECSCRDDDDTEDDDDYYEITCDKCGDTICINESLFDEDEIICPNCGEPIAIDFEDCHCEDCEGCEE